ncbi:testis expressed gene 16 [Cricetulus griseus]
MASDSIKRLMASEKTVMETENFWTIPDSESYAVESGTEKGRVSVSKLHLIQVEKTEKRRSKRYMEDSESATSETDSDSERHELASAAVKCFMDIKTAINKLPKHSWSERRTVNSDSESPVMSSDSAKHMKKAEICKSSCNLERLKVAHKSESLQEWLDAKRKQLDSGHSGHWDSSGKYQFRSIVPQDSFGKCQGDLQTFQSITEKDQVDSSSEKYQKKPGNESDQNEPENEKFHRKASRKISVYKRHCKEYRYARGCESFKYQISPIPPSSESSTSNVSSRVGSPNSKSLKSATRQKTRRSITFDLDVETQRCARCFMEISDSSFHKCPTNSDDSDSDSPLHGQISLDSKYSLRSKTVRHFKTSRNNPLSRSLDPKHRVGNRCSLHREDFRYSVDSTSYIHCERCSALQNLKGSVDTHTTPMKSEQIMGQHSTYGYIMSTPERVSESGLSAQPQNKDNPDDSARNIKDEADVEEELLSKDETDQEYETNTEDETDAEDETDTEDEDNNKDKKDPKDKSDPDGSDPKDGNSENNTDSNTGSDPSGASGPTSGPDSSNDGDSKNVTDHNNESDPAMENASNSDVNLEYSTDLDNASDLSEDFNQQNNVDTKGSTNPNSASGNKNRTVMDYISGSNNVVAIARNDTGQGNNIFSENIRPISNSLDFTQSENDPNNNPSPSNSHGLLKDLESIYNTKLSNVSSHDVVNPNHIVYPNYGTEPTSTAIHKNTATLKYYSDLNGVTGFTYEFLDNSASGGEGRSLAASMREIAKRYSEAPARGPASRPERGRPVRLERGYAENPATVLAVRPAQGRATIPARGYSMSPARGYTERCGRERAQSLARGYNERQARARTVSPFRMRPVSSAQGSALQQARRLPMRNEEEFLLGAAVGLTVKSAEGYDEETYRPTRQSSQ